MSDAVTTSQTIRFVHTPETYGQYRYLNEDELVEGMTALMVDIDTFRNVADVQFTGTTVIVDPDPLFDNHGKPMVRYHCISPSWDGQCFVSVENFTTSFADRDSYPAPGPRHEYWVSTRHI